MKTAVEWLAKQYEKWSHEGHFIPKHLLQQAKEMEKQQIMEAVEWGNRKGYDEHRLTCILDEDEDYYNETYKPSA